MALLSMPPRVLPRFCYSRCFSCTCTASKQCVPGQQKYSSIAGHGLSHRPKRSRRHGDETE